MKYFIFVQAILFSLLVIPAGAQNEQWDTYMAKFGNKPGSVLVDMGQMANAPDRSFPYLVITGPRAHNCNAQGIPDKEEISVLEEVLYATGGFLTGVTAKVLVGTFTYNCERLNYYYVKDTMGIRTAVRRMYDHNYKDYEYSISIKYDPEWKNYITFLYPDDATLNWMENDKIITGMIKAGDSIQKPRDINFELYFHSDTSRKAFETFAAANGYKTKKRTESKGEPHLYAIVVLKNSAVILYEINKMTAELKKEAVKHNGYFSGWEAPQN